MKTKNVIKFIKGTDNVDINDKCIGIHTVMGPDDRGLCIQIKHNGNAGLFRLATDMAELITKALNDKYYPDDGELVCGVENDT